MSLFIVAFFVALTFVPILAVHPFRVAEWRSFTWLVTALWTVGAIGAVANPFPSPLWVKVLLVRNRFLPHRRRRPAYAPRAEGPMS